MRTWFASTNAPGVSRYSTDPPQWPDDDGDDHDDLDDYADDDDDDDDDNDDYGIDVDDGNLTYTLTDDFSMTPAYWAP